MVEPIVALGASLLAADDVRGAVLQEVHAAALCSKGVTDKVQRAPTERSSELAIELQYVLQLATPTMGGRMLLVPQPNSPCTQRCFELINGHSRATLPHGRRG